tara:strand:+ start:121 stop:1290 length:1170 start_codon:yes stop_codon:yes gene_type:complete
VDSEEIRCGNRVFSGRPAEHPINKDLIAHFKSKGDTASWAIAESIEKYEEDTKKKVSRGADIASRYNQETERELAEDVEKRIEAALSFYRPAKHPEVAEQLVCVLHGGKASTLRHNKDLTQLLGDRDAISEGEIEKWLEEEIWFPKPITAVEYNELADDENSEYERQDAGTYMLKTAKQHTRKKNGERGKAALKGLSPHSTLPALWKCLKGHYTVADVYSRTVKGDICRYCSQGGWTLQTRAARAFMENSNELDRFLGSDDIKWIILHQSSLLVQGRSLPMNPPEEPTQEQVPRLSVDDIVDLLKTALKLSEEASRIKQGLVRPRPTHSRDDESRDEESRDNESRDEDSDDDESRDGESRDNESRDEESRDVRARQYVHAARRVTRLCC